jgi:hypothetical protein
MIWYGNCVLLMTIQYYQTLHNYPYKSIPSIATYIIFIPLISEIVKKIRYL